MTVESLLPTGKLDCQLKLNPDGSRDLVIQGGGLMGLAEVADALGVRVQNVDQVPYLPDPVCRVRATRLWLAVEINDFAAWRRKRKAASGR
jgi:hypothetical protein